MTIFLLSLAALGGALWLRRTITAQLAALVPVRVRRGHVRSAKS
jgi:hypothetical protein